MLIAIKDRSQVWRLRFPAVVTKQNGLILFPVHKTLHAEGGRITVPEEFRMNTIAVIGLEALQACFYALFNVFPTEPYSELIGVDISREQDVNI